jgi:hypothetical protein
MEDANFSKVYPEDSYPTSENEVTEFIKNRIKIYIDSWIAAPIKQALKELQ